MRIACCELALIKDCCFHFPLHGCCHPTYAESLNFLSTSSAPADPRARKFLGYIEAPDEKTAIGEAIKQFEIKNPEQQGRPIARARLGSVAYDQATVVDPLGLMMVHRASGESKWKEEREANFALDNESPIQD